jgi:hypothetical protein
MIDYYLHKKCPLVMATAKQIENVRCGGCIWLDKELKKCVFSLKFPRSVSTEELKERVNKVNLEQQEGLSENFRRFI